MEKIQLKRERENFGRAFFQYSRGKIQRRKQCNQQYVSLCMDWEAWWGGSWAISTLWAPRWERSSRGYWPPTPGEMSPSLYLSLFRPTGLSGPPGRETVGTTSLQGSYRRQAWNARRQLNLGDRRMDRIKDKQDRAPRISVWCVWIYSLGGEKKAGQRNKKRVLFLR